MRIITKMNVWKAGCAIFLGLLVFTLLSLEISDQLLIEVNVTQGREIDGLEFELPLSSLLEDGKTVYCIEKQKGIFRDEYVVKVETVSIIRVESEDVIIIGDSFYTNDGERPFVVCAASYPISKGDIVEVSSRKIGTEAEEKAYLEKQIKTQKKILLAGIPVAIFCLDLLYKIWICCVKLHEKQWKYAVIGIGYLLLFLILFFLYGNFLDIPREILKNILHHFTSLFGA